MPSEPGVADGLIGIDTFSLPSHAGNLTLRDPSVHNNTTTTGLGVIAVADLSTKSLLANQSSHTSQGSNLHRKAKEEDGAIYLHTKSIPSIANIGVLGTVAYYAYTNRDR